MKTFLSLFLLALLLATPAHAQRGGTRAQLEGDLFDINNMTPTGSAAQLGEKVVNESVHTLRAYYSFGVQGGTFTTTAITLRGTDGKAAKLPKGAIVRNCVLDFVTAATSLGSATISVGTGQSASDLKSALAVASATGLVACVPDGTVATAIKLTADRTPTVTIGTASLTAGKLWVVITYEMSKSTVP